MTVIVSAMLTLHPIPACHADRADQAAHHVEARTDAVELVRYIILNERPRSRPAHHPETGEFLACVRHRESRGQYGKINPSSGTAGAYQFEQSTWDATARRGGRSDLVGVNPANASPADQDAMAVALFAWQGRAPWEGPGC